jgi:hypothetical protein
MKASVKLGGLNPIATINQPGFTIFNRLGFSYLVVFYSTQFPDERTFL